MVPVAQIRPLWGRFPTFALSLPHISTVKTWFGYGLSKLMNVGVPRLEVAVCSPAISPQTVALSPRCLAASEVESVDPAHATAAKKGRTKEIILDLRMWNLLGKARGKTEFVGEPDHVSHPTPE